MKKLFILLILAFSYGYSICKAQSSLLNIEAEAGGSAIFDGENITNSKFVPTGNLFAEIRYNFKNTPFDAGIHFDLGALSRDCYDPKIYIYKTYHFKNFLLVGDYNFRRGKNISPYFGAGLGVSRQKTETVVIGPNDTVERGYSPCFMSRVGIEFFRVVRLSASYKFINRDYSNLECSLGLVFGGWKKSK